MDSLQGSGGTVSEQLLAAIAEREGVDLLDFDSRLYDVIDPDALDRLFRSSGMNGQIKFTYLGYEVAVFSDGRIALNSLNE